MNKKTLLILCLVVGVIAASSAGSFYLKSHLPEMTLTASFSIKAVVARDAGNLVISGSAGETIATRGDAGEPSWQPQVSYQIVDTSKLPHAGNGASDVPLASIGR